MADRKASGTITPSVHALMRAQKLSKLKVEREEKLRKLRRDLARESDERCVRRYGIDRSDPRLPLVTKAIEVASKKGLDVRDDQVALRVATKALRDHERTKSREATDVVYYLRCGEFIKIGTTNNLKRRLNAYPPGTEVLATEVGSFEREAARIEEFAEYLAGRREWFRPGERLMAHIAGLT